jgi:hypothetical protein
VSGSWQEARRWQEFGSITLAQRMVKEKVRERVPFIPLEAKGRGLDHFQVSKQELEHTSLREGRPT